MEAEFPVGRLLNGDSYKPVTRMKNISSAMTWVTKQLQGFRESDENLNALFKTLEKDVADLKSLYNDGGRQRMSSVSSINGLLKPQPSQSSIPAYQDVYTYSITITEEESTTVGSTHHALTHSDSTSSSANSLTEFAEELGLGDDDDEDDVLPTPSLFSRSSLKSHTSSASNVSDDTSYHHTVMPQRQLQGTTGRDKPAADSVSVNSHTSYGNGGFVRAYAGANSTYSSYNSYKQKDEERSHPDTVSNYSSRTGPNDSPVLSHVTLANTGGSHHSSNDSGNIADLENSAQFSSGPHPPTNSLEKTLTPNSLKPTSSGEDDKRLSGFADELFAMFNIK